MCRNRTNEKYHLRNASDHLLRFWWRWSCGNAFKPTYCHARIFILIHTTQLWTRQMISNNVSHISTRGTLSTDGDLIRQTPALLPPPLLESCLRLRLVSWPSFIRPKYSILRLVSVKLQDIESAVPYFSFFYSSQHLWTDQKRSEKKHLLLLVLERVISCAIERNKCFTFPKPKMF